MRGFRIAIELCGRTADASEESVAGDEVGEAHSTKEVGQTGGLN